MEIQPNNNGGNSENQRESVSGVKAAKAPAHTTQDRALSYLLMKQHNDGAINKLPTDIQDIIMDKI